MCVYCENFGKHDSELELNDVFIVSPAMYTQIDDGTPFIIPTNYCPNCGRELIKDKYLNLKKGDDIYYADKDNNSDLLKRMVLQKNKFNL